MDECGMLGARLKNLFFCSVDVFERIDWDEFVALNDADKDTMKLILCMAHVDLCEESHAKKLIWRIYPQQSKTMKAIKAMIDERLAPPDAPPPKP